ncbi:ankyrin repeat-containing protein [Brachyspira hampsonii 30599]|nr:ankyrin repeat-containing protein [Brachyspira hampsonii 30599]
MKNFISIISIFVLMISIISCGGGNKEIAENTQTNQTETNKVYVNPTTTNQNNNTNINISIDTTKYTNEYIQGTELDPMPTGYKKIDEILNEHKYKAPIYEISKLISEEGLEGKITETTNFGDKYIYKDSTPLFLAVQFGYNDLAKELIKEGADVNARANDMETETEGGLDMLYYAVRNNNPEMTKILIDKGLDKNRDYGYEYSTYLTDIAIGNNNLDILKLLVKRGDSKETLIPEAVRENNIEMVKYLLSIGQDIDAQIFFDGFWVDSPLKVAAENGYVEMAKFLIDEGANLNSADDYMLYAYNNYDITKLLVDNDVFNLNTNTTKEEAIKLVQDGKYYEIEKLLLSEDSNNIDGYDELMNAISKGDMKALEKLIKDDTDLNKQYDKITPLGLAAARNDKEMVKFLVEKGADINLEDGYGYTPLIIAMKYSNIGLAKDIIDLKPDLNAICSATGDTPLTYLVDKVKFGSDICYYLIKNGADVK